MTDGPLGTIGLVAVTLYVNDFDAALAWYDDKLGLQPMSIGSDGHAFAAFSLGATIVVLEPIDAALDPGTIGAETTTLNVMVDRDPVEVRDDLIARGVVCGEIVRSNYVSFLMRDLDGNRFYISRPDNDQARASLDDI